MKKGEAIPSAKIEVFMEGIIPKLTDSIIYFKFCKSNIMPQKSDTVFQLTFMPFQLIYIVLPSVLHFFGLDPNYLESGVRMSMEFRLSCLIV